jgi:RHS repeat-associated protein
VALFRLTKDVVGDFFTLNARIVFGNECDHSSYVSAKYNFIRANGNRIASAEHFGRVTTADNMTSTTVYDGVGRVAQTIDARGNVTGFSYDAAGKRLAVTNAFGTSVAITNFYGYDANGNQITYTDALNHVTMNFYDALNRQTNVTFADGTKQITVYDVAGRRITQTDQASITTGFGYDGVGHLIAVTNALNKITRYQYDEAGNEIAQIDALNRTNTFAYDGMGRRFGHTMPGGQMETFGYDLAGNLVLATNFNGVVITNQYDVMNRLTNQASANGYQVTYAYSPTGQRTNLTDPSGRTSYGYDNRDRLQLKTINWSSGPAASLNYLYDANGNLTNLWSSTANGVNLVYSYDPLSRLTNVVANGNAAAGYGFDLAGNLQTMRYGNGVTNLYQYDSLNRLTNAVWKLNANTLGGFYYQLGLTGNRTNLNESVNSTSQTYQWQYDNLYRLTNENISAIGSVGYAYDPVGNRTNRTSTVSQLPAASYILNPNDWLTNVDKYDNNGNTTNSAGIFYQYDALNHITNVNNGQILITYDGDGNRVSKTIGGTTTYYLLDDRNPSGYAQVVEEWISINSQLSTLNRVYTYGLSLIGQRTLSPQPSTNYFIYDGHRSTRILTDIGGNIVNAFAYDAYGTLIASNTAPQTAYLYCGQQFDPDLGLYDNRARYLNPNTGRLWTMDTYTGNNEDPLSLHKYLYAGDDPIDNVDPSGNDFEALEVGIALASFDAFHFSVSSSSAVTPGPETIYVRSFAPWNTFGGGFAGDNRSFTTTHVPGGVPHSAVGATSRITSIIKIQPRPLSIISQTAYSDPSYHSGMTSKTATPHVVTTVTGNTMHLRMWGANPLVSHAPDIDVKLDMSVRSSVIETYYDGHLYGDAFPNAEMFVVNPSDKATMLHTFTTSGSILDLFGNNNRSMGDFSVWAKN